MTNAEIERRLEDQAHDSAERQPPRPVTSRRLEKVASWAAAVSIGPTVVPSVPTSATV